MDFSSIASNPFFPMMVQYLIDFITTNKGKTQEEFIAYLQSKNDANLAQYIQQNEQLANYLANMIQDKSDEAKKQLAEINSMLASIMASTKVFAPLASMMNIQSDLSEQAVSILRQFVESGKERIDYIHHMSQPCDNRFYQIVGGEHIILTSMRYAEDDFDTLIRFGFIKKEYTQKNKNVIYKITRKAESFIKAIGD